MLPLPRPSRDLDERVYRALALGGRWNVVELSRQVSASVSSVSLALHRLKAGSLALRYVTGNQGAADRWVAVDPRGSRIEDVDQIISQQTRRDPWKKRRRHECSSPTKSASRSTSRP